MFLNDCQSACLYWYLGVGVGIKSGFSERCSIIGM